MSQGIESWDYAEDATFAFSEPSNPDAFDSVASPNRSNESMSMSAPFTHKPTLSSKSLQQHDEAMLRQSDPQKTITSLFDTFENQIPPPSTEMLPRDDWMGARLTQELGEDDEEEGEDLAAQSGCATHGFGLPFDRRLNEMQDDIPVSDEFCPLTPTVYVQRGTPRLNEPNLEDIPSNATMIVHERGVSCRASVATIDEQEMLHEWRRESMAEDEEDNFSVDDDEVLLSPQRRLMREQDSYSGVMDDGSIFPVDETTRHSSPVCGSHVSPVHSIPHARPRRPASASASAKQQRLLHGEYRRWNTFSGADRNRWMSENECSARRERRRDVVREAVRRHVRGRYKPLLDWMDERIESARKHGMRQ